MGEKYFLVLAAGLRTHLRPQHSEDVGHFCRGKFFSFPPADNRVRKQDVWLIHSSLYYFDLRYVFLLFSSTICFV